VLRTLQNASAAKSQLHPLSSELAQRFSRWIIGGGLTYPNGMSPQVLTE